MEEAFNSSCCDNHVRSNNLTWLEQSMQDMNVKMSVMYKLVEHVEPFPERMQMHQLMEEFHNSYRLLARHCENLTYVMSKDNSVFFLELSKKPCDHSTSEKQTQLKNTAGLMMSPIESKFFDVVDMKTTCLPRGEHIYCNLKTEKPHAHKAQRSGSGYTSSSDFVKDGNQISLESQVEHKQLLESCLEDDETQGSEEKLFEESVQDSDVSRNESHNLRNELLSSLHIMKNIAEKKVLNLEERYKEQVSLLLMKNFHLAEALRGGSNCLKEYEKKISILETSIQEKNQAALILQEENQRLEGELKIQRESGISLVSQFCKLQSNIEELLEKTRQLSSLAHKAEKESETKAQHVLKFQGKFALRIRFQLMGRKLVFKIS